MLDLILFKQAILVVATAIAAYTDWKTGLILDWLTLPLIGIGMVLNLFEMNWIGIGLGIVVFVFLYALYWLGKLGGGDVKLFTGIALLLPFYNNQFFLIPTLFFAALTAITAYSLYYSFQIFKQKIPLTDIKPKNIIMAVLFALLFSVYFLVLVQINALSQTVAIAFWVPFLLASVFVGLEPVIKKHFFVQTVALEKLGEDEVIALDMMDSKILEQAGLGIKGVIGEKEKQKLAELGIREVPIYANAPRFGPFIFLGVILALFFPNLVTTLFLPI